MSNLSAQSSIDTLYTVAAVRAIDHAAIHEEGIDGYALMTRAARAALDVALGRFPDAKRWQVVCGGGNNAGDGYVLARLAAEQGTTVSVHTLVDPGKLGGDAMIASNDFAASGGIAVPWAGELDPDADLLIDALLGSGLERDVGGDFAVAVQAMNAHEAPVLALDIPTGLHGDSGAVLGDAVNARVTVTFVGWKTGLFLGDGPEVCGELHFADLGIPLQYRQRETGSLRRLSARAIRAALPPRPRNAHKGSFGRVVVIGGGPGMPGAVRLAGEAALRSGAGLVSIATHPSQVTAVISGRPELMCHAVSSGDDLDELLADAAAVAIGPGLGRSDWAQSLFDKVMDLDVAMVLDADALNLLAEQPRQNDRWILTPHPGEAGRLLGVSAADVQADRLNALQELRARYSGTVVLKGAGTLSTSRDGIPWLCTAGNPGMASPGMGDVLTGVIAAFRAQGFDADDAAALGVSVHARSGDAAAKFGERGLLASDLIGELRSWVNH